MEDNKALPLPYQARFTARDLALAGYLLLAFSLRAQTQAPNLVGGGYRPPAALEVAPGQVITLFAHATNRPAQPMVARSRPLPTTLAGFSLSLRQTFATDSIPVPLLAVFPVDNCFGLFPMVCVELTAITVQIPLELAPNVPGSGRPANFAVLTITENEMTSEAFPLSPVSDNIHILTTCDATAALPGDTQTGICQAVVKHPDGTLVSVSNPATEGETLTLHAYGFGHAPNLTTGDVAPEAIAFPDVALDLRYGANLTPERPGETRPIPLFAGAAAGEVGLYYVVFQVPPVPAGMPSCIGGGIRSNLTVSIARTNSFDGAGICVDRGGGN
jgi:uncharacterized protein (TIGR03437 family)